MLLMELFLLRQCVPFIQTSTRNSVINLAAFLLFLKHRLDSNKIIVRKNTNLFANNKTPVKFNNQIIFKCQTET